MTDYPVNDGVVFGGEWWAWWTDLQPSDQVSVGQSLGRVLPSSSLGWGPLYQHRRNRFTLLVLGLAWWGARAAATSDAMPQQWLDAVDDVTWVLEQLLHIPNPSKSSKKRPEEEVASSS